MKKLIIIAVIVAIVLFAYFYYAPQSKDIKIENTFPEYFPLGIILEPYLTDLESVSDLGKLPEEQHRAVVSYRSQLNTEENKFMFEQSLRENGFEVFAEENDVSDFNGETIKEIEQKTDIFYIFGKKDKESMSITVWGDRTPVQISMLYIIFK